MVRHCFTSSLALLSSLALAPLAHAADWANIVKSYNAGLTYSSGSAPVGAVNQVYANTSSGQLNGLSPDTGEGGSFHDVLTPFNAAYSPSHIVGIGQGGSITLQFPTPIMTSGATLGIHNGIGLNDLDYPNGSPGPAPTYYNSVGSRATIEVSSDNLTYFNLGTFDLTNPSNYYTTGVTTPSDQPLFTGGTLADVSKPFTGNLSSFANENWTQILATLNGSAGGTWINLSPSGLPSVSYVRFSVPTGQILFLDGVVGIPAPEPASVAMLTLGATLLLARRARRRA